jgi:hypothetical protein
MEYETYCAVSAAGSRHFKQRIYKTRQGEEIPAAFLQVKLAAGVPKAEILHHLELIKSWLLLGEEVQTVHPGTFFCEMEKIPRLQVFQRDRVGQPKQWRGRYPKGKPRLI